MFEVKKLCIDKIKNNINDESINRILNKFDNSIINKKYEKSIRKYIF